MTFLERKRKIKQRRKSFSAENEKAENDQIATFSAPKMETNFGRLLV